MVRASNISLRLALGAVALMAALWLFHPGFAKACQETTPGWCLQTVWDTNTQPEKTKDAKTSPVAPAIWDRAVADLRAARDRGEMSAALAALDRAGQIAVRHYEAEEAKGATRRLRYHLVDLSLEARILADATERAKGDATVAERYEEVFASLASVRSVDLVLRRAGMRAPKPISFLSADLSSAIREFWQDLAPAQVFFATNRMRAADETGYFDPRAADDNAIQFGAATVSVPVYVNEVAGADQAQSVADAPEQGVRQTAGVRTVKHLDAAQLDAFARDASADAPSAAGLLYIQDETASFENAVLRAGELKLALRIAGPVFVVSWAGPDCASPATAKLVLLAWKHALAIMGRAGLHVIVHGQGDCAARSLAAHGGAAAAAEVHAKTYSALLGARDALQTRGDQLQSAAYFVRWPRDEAQRRQACAWDKTAAEASLWRQGAPIGPEAVQVSGDAAVPDPLTDADFYLPSTLNDLRARLWLGVPAQNRCGMCKLYDQTGLAGWRLEPGRCGEDYELALELRHRFGAGANEQIDALLGALTPQEREMVRAHVAALPVAR